MSSVHDHEFNNPKFAFSLSSRNFNRFRVTRESVEGCRPFLSTVASKAYPETSWEEDMRQTHRMIILVAMSAQVP